MAHKGPVWLLRIRKHYMEDSSEQIHLDPETILSLTPHCMFKFQNVKKRMQTCTSMSTLLRKGSQTAISCVEDMRFSNGDATFFSPKSQQDKVHFFNAWIYMNGIKNQAFSFSSISIKALISSLIETVCVFSCQNFYKPPKPWLNQPLY